MVPLTLKVPVPFDYVFPAGLPGLGVEAAVDSDRRHDPDSQVRDKESGERVWLVRVLDLDPAAGKFGRTTEVKVKSCTPQQPVPPASAVSGYPPAIEFDGLTLTLYMDSQRCKSAGACEARMAYSLRASSICPAVVAV